MLDLATVRLDGLMPVVVGAPAALVNVRVKYFTSSRAQIDTIIVACKGDFEDFSLAEGGSCVALWSGCEMITSTDASTTVVEARFV